MPARNETVRRFVRGLGRFVGLVAVAGGLGFALGAGLVTLADDVGPETTGARDDAATATTSTGGRTTAAPLVTPTIPTGTITAKPPTPATTTTAPSGPLARVRVRVLGAILHPAGTADGKRRRRARLTLRVRAINEGPTPLAIETPLLGIGAVRIRTDSAAETDATRFGELAAGETKAVTLRFELQGEATEKITIDRRARLNIAGRSVAFRLRLGQPVTPPSGRQADGGTQTGPETTQTTP